MEVLLALMYVKKMKFVLFIVSLMPNSRCDNLVSHTHSKLSHIVKSKYNKYQYVKEM